MTEDEAKTKWCPYVRVNERSDGGAVNRPIVGGGFNCIGSACMAWRVRAKYNLQGNHDVSGYCGLVGEPQAEEP